MMRAMRILLALGLVASLAFASQGCSDNVYGSVTIGTGFGGPGGGYGSVSMGFPIR